jgi:hypothetical protein
VSFVGCKNRLDNLSNHIAHVLCNKTSRISHPLEVGSAAQKALLNSRCPHQMANKSSEEHGPFSDPTDPPISASKYV